MAARTLHVRCATWEQVDVFTTRKLRKGKLLSMKVPFAAQIGMRVTLGLELPNEVVVAIDGVVHKAAPVEADGKPDGTRTWIEIELSGFTDEVKARLQRLREGGGAPQTNPQIAPAAPVRRSSSQIGGDDLPADERELFQHLASELRRLRQAAVHEVLGVPATAGPELVRASWKDLIRRHHPDLVARRNAPAITHLAEELTILANRAYDRMRSALVAEGRAATAGPTLTAPAGWLVAFEDIKSDPAQPSAPRQSPRRFERPPTPVPEPPPPPSSAGQGSEAFESRARSMLAEGDANSAREVLAAALVVYPRSKPLRSLYHVATALAAVQEGELMLATAQLETALAHHEQCTEALKMLELIRQSSDAEALKRLFR
jgi:hypothetical protein